MRLKRNALGVELAVLDNGNGLMEVFLSRYFVIPGLDPGIRHQQAPVDPRVFARG